MFIILLLMGISYSTIIIKHWGQKPFRRLLWPAVEGAVLVLLGVLVATEFLLPTSVIGRARLFWLNLLMVAVGALVIPLFAVSVPIAIRIERHQMSRPLPAELIPDDVKQRVLSSLSVGRMGRIVRWLVFDTQDTQRFVAYRIGATEGALMYDASAPPDDAPADSSPRWGFVWDRHIARAVARLTDGRTVRLNVRNGFWWAFVPDELANWSSIEFYNDRGGRLFSLPMRSGSEEDQDSPGE